MWKIQARSKRAHPQHLKVPPKFWICRSFSSSPRKNKKEKKRAFFFWVLAIWWIGPAYPTCDGSNAQRTLTAHMCLYIHDCESFSRVYICPVSGFSCRRYIIFWWREANRPTLVNECAVYTHTHRHPHLFIPDRERERGGELVKTKKEKKNWRCDERVGKNQEMRTFFLYFLTLWSVFDGSRDTLLCRQSNVTNQIWHSTAPMLDETFIFFWGEFRWCNRVQHISQQKKFLFHLIVEILSLCIYRQRSRSTRRVWRLRRLLFGWPFNKKKKNITAAAASSSHG